jgi:hypothetical protein
MRGIRYFHDLHHGFESRIALCWASFQHPGDIVIARIGDIDRVLRYVASLAIADLSYLTARNP